MGLVKATVIGGMGMYAIKKYSEHRDAKHSLPASHDHTIPSHYEPAYGSSPNEKGFYTYETLTFHPVESSNAYAHGAVNYASDFSSQNGLRLTNDAHRPLPPVYSPRNSARPAPDYRASSPTGSEDRTSRPASRGRQPSSYETALASGVGGSGGAALLNALWSGLGARRGLSEDKKRN